MWKETTQRYDENILFRIKDLHQRLLSGEYQPSQPHRFLYLERGKLRLIESYNIDDRIVQGCFTDYVLLPFIRPKLIYDNSASLAQRGTEHFRRRLEMHLRDFAKEHGNKGYILLCDSRKYYDNIRHEQFYDALRNFGADADTLAFARLITDAHKVDVSYMNDDEYATCMDTIFDAIKHFKIDPALKTGKRFMCKSVGVGSHIAQIAGIVYPYRIDNYIKIVEGIKGYGRYADDFYIIDESKDRLWRILDRVKQMSRELGLCLNENKTQVVNLRHQFTILKTRYTLRDTGALLRVPDPGQFQRCRRKLKALGEKLRNGEISVPEVEVYYKSTRGNLVRCGESNSVRTMDSYYQQIIT